MRAEDFTKFLGGLTVSVAIISIPTISLAQSSISAPDSTAVSSSQFKGDTQINNEDEPTPTFTANYFAIFYGPGVQNGSFDYQPAAGGGLDPNSPVTLKNFLGLSYNITDKISITPTAYWTYQPAGSSGIGGSSAPFQMQDPFVRIADSSVFYDDGLNLYSDIRFHLPLTSSSGDTDLRGGFQTVQALNYLFPQSRFSVGMYGSARYNLYGPQGEGNDLELYVGPNASYQFSPVLALTMLYETNVVHVYGNDPMNLTGDGTDFQPGVSWDITPNMNFNPYFNLNTSGRVGLSSTSVGAMLSVKLL